MDRLREMREAVGFTRARLARLSGVSVWRISMAELEGQQLSVEEGEALRRALRPELTKLAHSVLEFQTTER
jgi:transcriptional regulator with XRE-family HTH domain